ncbi:MAG: CAP domain-containing protein, partial [Clostridia bacterium]|nr:CAP domain-containing protein [Clostridia bacterium]
AETPEAPEQPAPSGEAEQILTLVNAARAQNGLSPLTLNTQMTEAANVRAKETVSQFSHTRPDGSSFSTALTQAGVSFRAYGENIAWGQRSAEAVMDTWMNSSGHRANILSSSYSRLGVGVYRDANGTPYWVQLFCD